MTVALIHFIKQLNIFDTYSTDENQIRQEILSTRVYLVLLPTILVVIITYSAQKELYHTVKVNNPSLDDYRHLLIAYPDTFSCPCSQLSVSYSTFVSITPIVHQVCSSDFTSDRWLSSLYHEDASSYIGIDIRSIGNAQFQLLRTLCESSKQAIANGLKATFASASLVNSHGILLSSDSVHVQVEAFARDFIANVGSEQRRRRGLLATFFDRNFLVSGLQTAAVPFIDSHFELKMKIVYYIMTFFYGTSFAWESCQCDINYNCEALLGIFPNWTYESDDPGAFSQYTGAFEFLVDGFRAGCLPLNSLILSTLECYYTQNCLDTIIPYLSGFDTSFNVLNRNVSKRFIPATSIGALVDEMMVEDWSKQIDYSRYFTACHPLSCSYSYTERFNILYIITTIVGLFGGLTVALRFVCPRLVDAFHLISEYILLRKARRPVGDLPSGKKSVLDVRLSNDKINTLSPVMMF
ncbi:unnamed protein product [Rotaria sp. Silwood2]|nr:unnamed protein product [Rotaria sp. Silwood2]CAF3023953.1 unnamed protein product [Rotaria sp. Silwood2]CAF4096372.1 unnamed protein product [Rotaria sp. Silwood2]CAF4305882.1 unnamed protein product [Rotaria sp. Silwood2]